LFNILVSMDQPRVLSDTSQRFVASQNPSSSARVIVCTDPGDPHPWDLGWRRNWTQVMGDKVWDWFLPIRPSQGDGARFEYNTALVQKLQIRAREIALAQSSRGENSQPSRVGSSRAQALIVEETFSS
jgi:hypothetical protein